MLYTVLVKPSSSQVRLAGILASPANEDNSATNLIGRLWGVLGLARVKFFGWCLAHNKNSINLAIKIYPFEPNTMKIITASWSYPLHPNVPFWLQLDESNTNSFIYGSDIAGDHSWKPFVGGLWEWRNLRLCDLKIICPMLWSSRVERSESIVFLLAPSVLSLSSPFSASLRCTQSAFAHAVPGVTPAPRCSSKPLCGISAIGKERKEQPAQAEIMKKQKEV